MKIQRAKKSLVILLALLMLVAAAGCSDKDADEAKPDDNIEKNVINDSGIDPTVDPNDIEFSLGRDDYGKDGWIYTSTGSMKMQIPEGWEVQSSLSESSMGVRSAQEDGDVIMVEIEEYSSMIDDQTKRTPENQAKQNNEDATITKDRWGNTDVWYRVTEWTDYVAIAGYAAYDAEEYVNFDIRVKTINGTLEEFMESNAWSTLKTTFEIRTP